MHLQRLQYNNRPFPRQIRLQPQLLGKSVAWVTLSTNTRMATGDRTLSPFYFFSSFVKPIEKWVKAPLVTIVAEGDYVIMTFASERTDPKDVTKKYVTTWFDRFRIESGKIAEHWDAATK